MKAGTLKRSLLCTWLAAASAAPDAAQCVLAKLAPDDPQAGQHFGGAVAIDGDTAIVGAYSDGTLGTFAGAAYVFRRSGDAWVQEAKLLGSGVGPGDWFGLGIALSGDWALIAAVNDDEWGMDSGAAYVFHRTAGGWVEDARLTASDAASLLYFGAGDIDGERAIVGAWGDGTQGPASGAAYVFERGPSGWTQVQKLLASGGAAYDRFGGPVALDGDMALIGAGDDDTSLGTDSGSVRVFELSGPQWIETDVLTPGPGDPFKHFGGVSRSGNTAVVTAPSFEGQLGAVYVFELGPSGWVETDLLVPADPASADRFGAAASISADRVVVGDPQDDEAGYDAGAAYLFTRSSSGWEQSAKLTAGAAADDFDQRGRSVAVAGDVVLVGQDYDDDYASAAGAAYLYSAAGTDCDDLFGEPPVLPIQTGGIQYLFVVADPAHAGELYLALGSVSGTSPGVTAGPFTLPLNPDAYLLHTLNHPGALPLLGGVGFLDGSGKALVEFVLPIGLDPAFVGLVFHHAYAVLDVPGSGAVLAVGGPEALRIGG